MSPPNGGAFLREMSGTPVAGARIETFVVLLAAKKTLTTLRKMLDRDPTPQRWESCVGDDELASCFVLDGGHRCQFKLAARFTGDDASGMFGLHAEWVEDKQCSGRSIRLGT